MNASDYRVTFPYGATEAPYSSTHPHRGDDRPTPLNTPVVVEGVTIGFTGSTGLSTGPHLHIQEWQGSYSNTRKPQNSFKGGEVVKTGFGSDFGNFITIKGSDGWNTTYAHLNKINVQVGQKVGGMTEDGVRFGIKGVTGQDTPFGDKKRYEDEVRYWIGRDSTEFAKYLYGLGDFYMIPARKRIKELEAISGDVEANLLGRALIKLIASFGYKKG